MTVGEMYLAPYSTKCVTGSKVGQVVYAFGPCACGVYNTVRYPTVPYLRYIGTTCVRCYLLENITRGRHL